VTKGFIEIDDAPSPVGFDDEITRQPEELVDKLMGDRNGLARLGFISAW
jgi:hypothetical protein